MNMKSDKISKERPVAQTHLENESIRKSCQVPVKL